MVPYRVNIRLYTRKWWDIFGIFKRCYIANRLVKISTRVQVGTLVSVPLWINRLPERISFVATEVGRTWRDEDKDIEYAILRGSIGRVSPKIISALRNDYQWEMIEIS